MLYGQAERGPSGRGGWANMAGRVPKVLAALVDPRRRSGPIWGTISEILVPLAPAPPSARLAGSGGLPPTLGRIGSLEVRLAHSAKEVKAAQRLRYEVFYEEMSAAADVKTLVSRRDSDSFDRLCDHLLVVDHGGSQSDVRPRSRVVGTYRLLRQDVAERNFGFYTASEFDIQPLVAAHPGKRFLELGRSCVLAAYRNKRTVELLWHGIWTYVLHHRIDVMIGCASLEGTDPGRLALPLAFLHHHAGSDGPWRVRALPHRYVPMNRLAKEAVDPRAALHALPPLVKGYLRLGALIGDGAVVDHQFGTTDVLVVLPVERINMRYLGYFGPAAERHAA
jgi:L-ornithine Nalpha-acyltransferase